MQYKLVYIYTTTYSWAQSLTSGPLMPLLLQQRPSMVRLGKGQAILASNAKIYSMGCSNRNCIISLLNRELSVPKEGFVAIPIPDTTSGCITGGKNSI